MWKTASTNKKKVCIRCHLPLSEDEEICPACGTRQTQEEVVEEEDPYKGYWKKQFFGYFQLFYVYQLFF